MLKKVRINADIPGSIVVDDVDLSSGVTGFTLAQKAGHVPELCVDIAVIETEIEGEMQVFVHAKAQEALIALGWTPPAA